MRSAAILIVLLHLAACSHMSEGEKPLPHEFFLAYQHCDTDSDCVRATNGCCDCANGGEMIAVHRKHEKEVRDLFSCPHVMCAQRAGDCMYWIPYCEKEKGAQAGRCALKPPGKKLYP